MRGCLVTGLFMVFVAYATLKGTASAETWRQEALIEGMAVPGIHGLQGLAFGPDGALYIGSVMGQTITRLDLSNSSLETVVAAPDGEADDVAFGPEGAMAWTALNAGELRLRYTDGRTQTVATGLAFANPVTFGPDGTLYAASLFGPDQLWAYTLSEGSSRLVAENLGGLNGFEFGPDGLLYTPLPQQQAVGRLDVETGAVDIFARDVGNVVAVKFHPDGLLYGVSWDDGHIIRIDPMSGWTEVVAVVPPPLDNLAIDQDGMIYVTRSADNGLVAVDPVSGVSKVVMRSDLAAPGGMTWIERDGAEFLLITDIFGYRFFDPVTGKTTLLPFDLQTGASSDADARDGLIALSYVRRDRVLLLDAASGDVVQTWADVDTPYGILIEGNGSVVVANHERGTLVRLSVDDAATTTLATSLAGPVSLAWAEPGRAVYVAEASAGRVSRVDLRTGHRQTVVDGLIQPEGLAVRPNGHIVITEVGKNQVVSVDPATEEQSVLAQNLAFGSQISRAPDPVAMPTGVAVDRDDAVYVVTDAENGLIRLVPTATPNEKP